MTGGNGAGKTTILHTISVLRHDINGEITDGAGPVRDAVRQDHLLEHAPYHRRQDASPGWLLQKIWQWAAFP